MVLKQKKYSVPSGTTFRKGSQSYRHKYLRQATLVKSVRNANSDSDSSEEDFHPGIEYSLNKKGRWNLPKEIRQTFNESDERISLRQFHKIKRRAKCISYESNKGPVRTMVPKKFYCDVGTVEPKKVNKGSDNEDAIEDSVEVVYSVYLPAGARSAITYNPKYIHVPVYAQAGDEDHIETAVSRKGRVTKQRTGRYHRDDWDSDEQENSWESASDDDAIEYDGNRSRDDDWVSAIEGIDGFIDVALQKKEFEKYERLREPEVKTPKPTEISVKDRKIYIDAPTTTRTPVIDVPTLPDNAAVQLSSLITSPENLRQKYGLQYAEAGTNPRRFVINITDYLTREADEVNASLVFQQDREEKYDVTLRISPRMTSDVPICGKTSIDDIIEAVLNTYTLPVEYNNRKKKPKPKSFEQKRDSQVKASSSSLISHPVTFNHIKHACGWSVESRPHRQITAPSKKFESCNIASDSPAQTQTDVCEVCYSDEFRMMCMTSCCHVFCELCWTSYVTNALKNGVTKVTCPGYKCSEELTEGLIQSLVEPALFRAHVTARMDNFLAVNRWCWCPNPQCGRVLKTQATGTSGRSMNVDCDCRLNVCNDCKQQNHWPATCEQTQAYRKLMHERGDDNTTHVPSFPVRYMTCPSCNRAVEKVEGCNYVYCLCRKGFCWNCGGDWETPPLEGYHHYYCVMKKRKLAELRHIPTPVSMEAAPALYVQALGHHHLLHRSARQEAHHRLAKLIDRALNCVRKAVPGKFGYSCQVVQEARADYTELETCAIEVLNELHHCAEYTSVLLLYSKAKSLPSPELVEQCLDKIQFITVRFHQILKAEDRPATELLQQLRHCYHLGQRSICQLVTALKLNRLA